MHARNKVRIFRLALRITYFPALIVLYLPMLLRRKSYGRFFFFFDRYDLGGAQRVHLDILDSIPEESKTVFFTQRSKDGTLYDDFCNKSNIVIADIHRSCVNIIIRLFSIHYWAFYLNRHKGAVVFSSVSTFFYDMTPFISKKLARMELLHNFNNHSGGLEHFGLLAHRYLDIRFVIDRATEFAIKKQYRKEGISEKYDKRITFTETGVVIPATNTLSLPPPLQIFYGGRGGPQKRIWLLNEIARHCIQQGWPVQFHFSGPAVSELSDDVKAASVIYGNISSIEEMYSIYSKCHAIILTSGYEGFPMFIKEGMANGCVPIVTALKGNLAHLKHEANSLLIDNPEDEQGVIAQGISLVQRLCREDGLYERISASAYQYAKAHFSKELFLKKYRSFLLQQDC